MDGELHPVVVAIGAEVVDEDGGRRRSADGGADLPDVGRGPGVRTARSACDAVGRRWTAGRCEERASGCDGEQVNEAAHSSARAPKVTAFSHPPAVPS